MSNFVIAIPNVS